MGASPTTGKKPPTQKEEGIHIKIDASRFNLFWSNPERYRLRELWKLAPIEPQAGTFASLMTYGRRRGTAFHEMLDGNYRQVAPTQTVRELKDGGFGDKEIAAASRMFTAVQDKYPNQTYLAHEVLFEFPIGDGRHTMTGRIDGILSDDEGPYVADWKSSKHRTKKDLQIKAADYCRSSQVPFYLIGAETLGFQTRRFLYRLVIDFPGGVAISEHWTTRTGLELKNFIRTVHITCDLIEHMKATYGVQDPWPTLPEPFGNDYASMIGRKMYNNFMPEGYERKCEHLETMDGYGEDDEEAE